MKNFIIGVLLTLAIGLSILMRFNPGTKQTLGKISANTDAFSIATISSSSSVATSTTSVLSKNDNRSYARIENIGTNQIWCRLGTASSSADQGFSIHPIASSTFGYFVEFGVGHIPYLGAVQCIAETAATLVSITEN